MPDTEPGAVVSLPTGAPVAPQPARAGRWPRRFGPLTITRGTAGIAATAAALLAAVSWAGTGYRYRPYVDAPVRAEADMPTGDRELKQLVSRLDRRSRELTGRLKAAAPRGVYIVIDQTQNRLYLKRDEETLLEARCSAGSGMVLKETGGKNRQWVFDTPRGRFEVLGMLRNPVWAKPDWAFVEEGEPIPKDPGDRLEYGSLGEYALYFGNGYMIHGTLYERLLGRPVSHGCIRLGREPLREVYRRAPIGTPVYIY